MDYFSLVQTDITTKMRATLIDWLVDVHAKHQMKPQTLFMAVNIIDRFLQEFNSLRTEFQLVGITALFIASKYTDIYPPEMREFTTVCSDTYSIEELLEMENKIILSLNFDLVFTSSY